MQESYPKRFHRWSGSPLPLRERLAFVHRRPDEVGHGLLGCRSRIPIGIYSDRHRWVVEGLEGFDELLVTPLDVVGKGGGQHRQGVSASPKEDSQFSVLYFLISRLFESMYLR